MICRAYTILSWSRNMVAHRTSRLSSVVGAVLLLTSCATAPPAAMHFVPPSTAPIEQASAKISKSQITTHQHIQKAEDIVKTLTITLPEDKVKVDALTVELQSAQASNDQLKSDNDRLATDSVALKGQIDNQTQACNSVSDNLSKEVVKNQSLETSRHGWVKRFWIVTGLLLAAGIWIFKGPLLALTGIGI